MSKIITTLLMLTFVSSVLIGQKTNQVKLHYGFVKGGYIPSEVLDGSGSSEPFNASEVGIKYNKKINQIFRVETGINFFSSKIIVEGAPSSAERNTFKDNLELVSIPISVIAEFWKYFYVNGGLLIDLQAKTTKYLDSQSGIGLVTGLGAKYEYKDLIFYVNPEVRGHRLIGFKTEKYPEFLLNSSVLIGVGYNF